MYKKFTDRAAYEAAAVPTDESRVALIADEKAIEVDGVNVQTTVPEIGDAVYADASGDEVYIKKGTVQKSLISSDWTKVGDVTAIRPEGVLVTNGNASTQKWADVIQFKVTVPEESGTLSLGAQFVTAGTTTVITVEYEAGMTLATTANTYEINSTTLCGLINTALAALDGITGDWWAYVNSDGDVILQRDTFTDYRQYLCSGALTFVMWGTMPASATNIRKTGHFIYWAPCCYEKSITYYGGSGTSDDGNGTHADALTEQVPLQHTNLVNKYAFLNSTYCDLLRAAYSDYEAYIKANGMWLGYKYGIQATMTAKEVCETYGDLTAPMKSGDTKYKFPALHYARTIGYGSGNLAAGNWYVPDFEDAYDLLGDNRSVISDNLVAMGFSAIGTGAGRWLGRRYGVYAAWFILGSAGNVNYGGAYGGYAVQPVALLPLK